jgi:hypothetical protein
MCQGFPEVIHKGLHLPPSIEPKEAVSQDLDGILMRVGVEKRDRLHPP